MATSQGVKILGKDLEKALAGLPLLVAHKEDEIPVLKVTHRKIQNLSSAKEKRENQCWASPAPLPVKRLVLVFRMTWCGSSNRL